MQALYDQVVTCIKKKPSERQTEEVEFLCKWFVQKLDLLNTIKIDVVKDLIRNCEFSERRKDTVIIKQGEKGDCFFVILSGRVSVYINTDAVPDDPEDPLEIPIIGDENEPNNENEQNFSHSRSKDENSANIRAADQIDPTRTGRVKVPELDRSKYGQNVSTIESGKSFGELALINKDCIRNASIIVDENVHLLVVSRELYNRSLRSAQEAEFKARTDFVSQCPLFANWQPKYKRQAAMSLRKEQLQFGMDIVRQGEVVNGLVFIMKGQAKVVINVPMHYTQYPDLKLHEIDIGEEYDQRKELATEILEQNLDFREEGRKKLFAHPRRRQGYSLAEQRRALKNLEVSLVGEGEIIGDVEKSFELPTYTKSYISTVTSDVYFLDEKNYDRLISVKRNYKTFLAIREEAEMKVLSRVSRSLDKQVPLIHSLVHRIMAKMHKLEEVRAAESGDILASCLHGHHHTAGSNSAGTLPNNRESSFIPARGALIDLYGPGTVFFRNRKKRQVGWRAGGSRAHPFDKPKGLLQPEDSGLMLEEEGEGVESEEGEEGTNFIDWETSADHLTSLEDRLKNWFSNMESGTAPLRASSSDSVVKLRRYIKKDEGQVIHPGKTILLRPKKTPPSTSHFSASSAPEDTIHSIADKYAKEKSRFPSHGRMEQPPSKGLTGNSAIENPMEAHSLQRLEASLNSQSNRNVFVRPCTTRPSSSSSNTSSSRPSTRPRPRPVSSFAMGDTGPSPETAVLPDSLSASILQFDDTTTFLERLRICQRFQREQVKRQETQQRRQDRALRRVVHGLPQEAGSDPVGFAVGRKSTRLLKDILTYRLRPEDICANLPGDENDEEDGPNKRPRGHSAVSSSARSVVSSVQSKSYH